MTTDSLNRCGLHWIYVRLYHGSFGEGIEALPHFEYDKHSKPRKDSDGKWIFSLKHQGEDVCMIRCAGKEALDYALGEVNKYYKGKTA